MFTLSSVVVLLSHEAWWIAGNASAIRGTFDQLILEIFNPLSLYDFVRILFEIHQHSGGPQGLGAIQAAYLRYRMISRIQVLSMVW